MKIILSLILLFLGVRTVSIMKQSQPRSCAAVWNCYHKYSRIAQSQAGTDKPWLFWWDDTIIYRVDKLRTLEGAAVVQNIAVRHEARR